jgi:peptidoglycan hydrolase CwlO-like protein
MMFGVERKKIYRWLAILVVCLLVLPLGCSKPPQMNQIFNNTPVAKWVEGERKKIETEINREKNQLDQLIKQIMDKKEKISKEITDLQTKIKAFNGKIEKLNKFLQSFHRKK